MTQVTNLEARRANLSAAKRALLEKRLQGQLKSINLADKTTPRATNEPARLAYPQQRLWFLHELAPDSPAYNLYNVAQLKGSLDVAALEWSLNQVTRRHAALRTTFGRDGADPTQRIAPTLTLTIPIVDLQDIPAFEREARAQQAVIAEARRPFDLANGPLVRLTLFKLKATEYILVFNVPHLIFDEWSNEIFWREMSAFYQARVAGTACDLPDLAIQYADFADWQRGWLQRGALEKQLTYWKEQLGGELPLLQLPTDYPRPTRQTFQGALEFMKLPASLTTPLQALNQRAGATMFMTLLAAFKVLLYRYSRQTDILVGTPMANRNRPEIEDLIGLFLNTLVIRTDLADNPSFLELLKRVRQTALDAYAHQDVPFEKLVEELQPERDARYNPVFQVMFVYQKDAVEELDLPGLTIRRDFIDAGVAKFDLTLFVNETEQGLTAAIEYNTDLFAPDTVRRMLGHLGVLLESIAADPQQPIARLPLLAELECSLLLDVWNMTQADYPRQACIHHLIEAQVAQKPNAIAVRYEGAALTYDELNRQANQLAHHLQSLGLGPNRLVGLYMERSLEMIVAILGILKAGGAYVPLDPSYPPERLAHILTETQAPVLLTQERLAAGLPQTTAQFICLDRDWAKVAATGHEHNPESGVSAEDLVYVIYTSGSTGKPKGVQIRHRNLVHSTSARLNYYPEPVVSFLLLSSVAFDSSIVGIFGALCQGGVLVLPRQGQEQDIHQIASLISQHQISHLLSLPSLYDLLLTFAEPDQLASLREVMVAGEACPKSLSERHYRQLPAATLYNEYGPTEGTVWATVYRVPPDPPDSQVPIGRPIANTQLYVLDECRQPVPIGVPGELYLGGEGLALGYLKQPELTAEKFIPHPFSQNPTDRLYRTGDLVRYLPDGNLEFLGRVDEQIKLRGYRIELGEIEAALRQHAAVRDVVVIALDSGAEKRLAAYYVPAAEAQLESRELRRFLQATLPDFMTPATFTALTALPLTPNGKLDRRALPQPEPEPDTVEIAPPRTDTEKTIAELWQELLSVNRVGLYDDFFALGGHSLLVIQLIARLRNCFDVQLPLNSFFETPTVVDLAEQVDTLRWSAQATVPAMAVSEGELDEFEI